MGKAGGWEQLYKLLDNMADSTSDWHVHACVKGVALDC